MNDHEEIELQPREEQTKPRKIYPKQIDLTIDEDLRQIEDSKEEMEENYEQAYQQAYQESYGKGEYYPDEEQDEDFSDKEFPPIPFRAFFIAIMLLVTGIGFIVGGVMSYVDHASTSRILTFMFLGVFLTSPGCIYVVFIIQALRAKTPEEKEEVLNQIPI